MIAALLLTCVTGITCSTGTVEGRVYDCVLGTPVSSASVLVEEAGVTALTDSLGYYQISDVPAGFWDVKGMASGYRSLIRLGARVLAGSTLRLNFTLKPLRTGESLSLQDFETLSVVTAHAARRSPTEGVTGVVTDAESGQPICNAQVEVRNANVYSFSDEVGGYWIAGIQPGCWSLQATAMGYEPVAADSVFVEAGRAAVLDFRLQPRIIEIR